MDVIEQLRRQWLTVSIGWPALSTQWMDSLSAAQDVASAELASTALRLESLKTLATTVPNLVAAAAQSVIDEGRRALEEQLTGSLDCLAITPFQAGSGTGSARTLAAPELLQIFADKLLEIPAGQDEPEGVQSCAVVVMFLATRMDQLSEVLSKFNAVLPVPDLVRAERRALHLAKLAVDKFTLPSAPPPLPWKPLPLARCTVTKAAQQAIAGQLAVLEGYAADSAPLADLASLSLRKVQQQLARSSVLDDLKSQLTSGSAGVSMRAKLLGPGTRQALREQLLDSDAPGPEWVQSAGVMLTGSLTNLRFVSELMGL